jgi:hypothetical protein
MYSILFISAEKTKSLSSILRIDANLVFVKGNLINRNVMNFKNV